MPVRNVNKECVGFACVIRDITDLTENTKHLRQAMRKAEKTSLAKTDFLNNLSSDLKERLEHSLAQVIDLDLKEFSKKTKQSVDTVRSKINDSINLLRNVLDFSKMESGKLRVEDHCFDLHLCIQEISNEFHGVANEKNISILIEIADDKFRYIYGDSNRIRQVLYNLLANALKYTHEGQINIRIEDTGSTYPSRNLKISIEDTGIGITEDEKEKIIKGFSTYGTSKLLNNKDLEKTGLGLSICNNIVNAMSGVLDIESTHGKGSIFTIELPVRLSDEITPIDAMKHNQTSSKTLLVDENPVNQVMLTRILNSLGLQVTIVKDLEEAINELNNSSYQILIIDSELPDGKALELCEHIRQENRHRHANTPTKIILAVPYLNDDIRNHYYKYNISAFLKRPFNRESIQSMLASIDQASSNAPVFENNTKQRFFTYSKMMNSLHPTEQADLIGASELYLKTYLQDLNKLSHNIDDGLRKDIAYQIHRLKQTLDFLSDRGSVEIAEAIEEGVKDLNIQEIKHLFNGLEVRMKSLAQEIKYWLAAQ